MPNPIFVALRWLLFERPASGKSLTKHTQELHKTRDVMLERYQQADDTADNHRVMTHVIGIERWAQSRIRVVLGEALRDDEYDDYRPAQETTWDELQAMLEDTRAKSIQLADSLEPAMLSQRVPHNAFGQMTIGAWLYYIYGHGNLETKRLS